MKQISKKLIAAVLILILLTVVAIVAINNKSNGGSGSSTLSTATATDQVTIQNYMFSPMSIKVKTGTTVTWTNKDDVHHTVTSKGTPAGINSPELAQNQTYSYTFTKTGNYDYYCQNHPYMTASVVVTN